MEMDSYRVGTLLELVREAALGFAEYGLKCRVCVQGSMGQGAFQGVPRVLSGVNKLLQLMDWQARRAATATAAAAPPQPPQQQQPQQQQPQQHTCTRAHPPLSLAFDCAAGGRWAGV